MRMLLWLATIIPALHSEPSPEAIDIYLETNCAAVWDMKWKKISSQCNPSWNEMAVVAPEENCSIKSKANLNSKDRRARAMREMRVSVFQNHHCILRAGQSASHSVPGACKCLLFSPSFPVHFQLSTSIYPQQHSVLRLVHLFF